MLPQVYVAFNVSTSTLFTLIVVLSTTITIGFHRIVLVYLCCNNVVFLCIRICHNKDMVEKFSVYLHALFLSVEPSYL